MKTTEYLLQVRYKDRKLNQEWTAWNQNFTSARKAIKEADYSNAIYPGLEFRAVKRETIITQLAPTNRRKVAV